uniref:Uncharacterized protein n=1 Tax=Glossina palpalis gambiensis TaxID=67801 RepID=A0A1B0BRY8_9MUSC
MHRMGVLKLEKPFFKKSSSSSSSSSSSRSSSTSSSNRFSSNIIQGVPKKVIHTLGDYKKRIDLEGLQFKKSIKCAKVHYRYAFAKNRLSCNEMFGVTVNTKY